MFAIVSLIAPSNYYQPVDFKNWLEGFFASSKNPERFLLHLTWHAADLYDLPALTTVLSQYTARGHSFKIRTAGFGLFNGKMPVFYISLVKPRFLLDFHEEIWRLVSKYAIKPLNHFAPENWVPHITLEIIDDFSNEIISKIKTWTFRDMEFKIDINNIAIIYKNEQQSGILEKYDLPEISGTELQ